MKKIILLLLLIFVVSGCITNNVIVEDVKDIHKDVKKLGGDLNVEKSKFEQRNSQVIDGTVSRVSKPPGIFYHVVIGKETYRVCLDGGSLINSGDIIRLDKSVYHTCYRVTAILEMGE